MNYRPSPVENKDSQKALRSALFAPKILWNFVRLRQCISRIKSLGRRWCVIVLSFFACGTGRTILSRPVRDSKSINLDEQFLSLLLVIDAIPARRLMPMPASVPSSATIAWHSLHTPTVLISPLAYDLSMAFTPHRLRGLRSRACSSCSVQLV